MKPTSQVFKSPESASLGLTPHGMVVAFDAHGASQESGSEGELLMSLGAHSPVAGADPTFFYWRSIAHHLIRAVCQLPDARQLPSLLKPSLFMEWSLNAPPMRGGEYLLPEVLQAIWERLDCEGARYGEGNGTAGARFGLPDEVQTNLQSPGSIHQGGSLRSGGERQVPATRPALRGD